MHFFNIKTPEKKKKTYCNFLSIHSKQPSHNYVNSLKKIIKKINIINLLGLTRTPMTRADVSKWPKGHIWQLRPSLSKGIEGFHNITNV